jgi:hypothetical protein
MSISISPNLPANVVEIGNEITQAKINEINSGTLATQTFVATNYAPKANPTFTGIVTIPAGANISGYLPLSGGQLTGTLTLSQVNGIYNTDFVIDAYNDTGMGTHYLHTFTNTDGRFLLATNGGGLTFPDGTTQTTAGYPNGNPNGYTAGITDAPSDGNNYARNNGAWVQL